jgi:hypothetical protein
MIFLKAGMANYRDEICFENSKMPSKLFEAGTEFKSILEGNWFLKACILQSTILAALKWERSWLTNVRT